MTTPTPTPSATWEAMSDGQRVEWLAQEMMGWEKRQDHAYRWRFADDGTDVYWEWGVKDRERFGARKNWNPLTSWDHWRQVELKVMEDEKLWTTFLAEIWSRPSTLDVMRHSDEIVGMADLMNADLPERARALYLAHHSLHD